MQEFDKISIAEISKKDMLMIIRALEYTGNNTKEESYLSLRKSIINDLIQLADSNEDEFLSYLKR